jgi:ABC-type amino acid transport substrate-binding protein
MERDHGREHRDSLYGISVWLWKEVCKATDLHYRVEKMPLDSLLYCLGTHRVDVGINPLTITAARSADIDFSAPYYISNSTVLIRESTAWQKVLGFLSSFFSLNFLRAVFALLLVITVFGILLWLVERRANADEFGPGLRGIGNGIWWSAVTMTTVGYGDKSPRTFAGRLIALVWMFAAILLISGLTAGIASSLTVSRLNWRKDSIDDFKNAKVATVRESATESFLQRRFFKKIHSMQHLDDCVAALHSGAVSAVAYDEPLLQYIARRDTSQRFVVLPMQFNHQLYAFAFAEGVAAPIKEQITTRLLRITESTDWDEVLGEYGLSKK